MSEKTTPTCSIWTIRMAKSTASMPVTTATSAASSTTCATPTSSPCGCSCCTRTCAFPASPSSAVGTSTPEKSSGLTTATASGTSRASTSPASVARRSVNIRLRPLPWSRAASPGWRPTRRSCPTAVAFPPLRPKLGFAANPGLGNPSSLFSRRLPPTVGSSFGTRLAGTAQSLC